MSEDATQMLLREPNAFLTDQHRVELIARLASLFQECVSPELRSCLWMSDMEMLRKIVEDAEKDPEEKQFLLTQLLKEGRIVQQREFIASLCLFLSIF